MRAFSGDGKYMVKTISRDEWRSCRQMLPHYYAHLSHFPRTLLARYVGLYRLQVKGTKYYFCVMQVSAPQAHRRHCARSPLLRDAEPVPRDGP